VSRYIDEHRGRFGVGPICETLGVSASAYYERRKGERSARAVSDEHLPDRIRVLHEANYCAYGYRRMWKALERAGERVPRCRVQRLMAINGIEGAKRRGRPWRTTKSDPEAKRRPDLVERNFSVSGPNRLWVADLSYLRCWEGLVFFAFVLDAFSRMVVGWQLSVATVSPRAAERLPAARIAPLELAGGSNGADPNRPPAQIAAASRSSPSGLAALTAALTPLRCHEPSRPTNPVSVKPGPAHAAKAAGQAATAQFAGVGPFGSALGRSAPSRGVVRLRHGGRALVPLGVG